MDYPLKINQSKVPALKLFQTAPLCPHPCIMHFSELSSSECNFSDAPPHNEDATKKAVVLHIFRGLGWDTENMAICTSLPRIIKRQCRSTGYDKEDHELVTIK